MKPKTNPKKIISHLEIPPHKKFFLTHCGFCIAGFFLFFYIGNVFDEIRHIKRYFTLSNSLPLIQVYKFWFMNLILKEYQFIKNSFISRIFHSNFYCQAMHVWSSTPRLHLRFGKRLWVRAQMALFAKKRWKSSINFFDFFFFFWKNDIEFHLLEKNIWTKL